MYIYVYLCIHILYMIQAGGLVLQIALAALRGKREKGVYTLSSVLLGV